MKLSIYVLSIVMLFFGFLSNAWHVAEQGWFDSHQRDTESLVVGRMVKSRQDGFFSAGGLTGAGSNHVLQQEWVASGQVQAQYSAYLDKRAFDEYGPYMSQIGGQAMVFSLLDRLIPVSPRLKLRSFYVLTSLLTALALVLIVGWFYAEFGWVAAVFVASSMILSQWLTVFGRNLWWSLWAFYLPMVVIMSFLQRYRASAGRQAVVCGTLVFASVFIKCFINGYEYMTTTLVMMAVPFVYYAIRDRWSLKLSLQWTFAAIIGSCIAILLTLIILCFQIGAFKGDFSDGVAHVVYSLGKRTHGEAQNFPDVYAGSLKAGTVEVVRTYMSGIFFDLNNYLSLSDSLFSRSVLRIKYSYLIIASAVMSALVLFRGRGKETRQRQRHIALIAATWFSILAPLSWYVIFKAHSFIHTHMSFVLWQMPFTFFGFALLAPVLGRGVDCQEHMACDPPQPEAIDGEKDQ